MAKQKSTVLPPLMKMAIKKPHLFLIYFSKILLLSPLKRYQKSENRLPSDQNTIDSVQMESGLNQLYIVLNLTALHNQNPYINDHQYNIGFAMFFVSLTPNVNLITVNENQQIKGYPC